MIQAQTQMQMRTGAVIQVQGLTKRYRNQTAVDGLSLSVPEGSIFGLLGENGAGKTTTIQMLLGLVKPDGGRIDVLGLDPARQGFEVRRRIGYVPEVPVLYDWMTVAEIGWFAAGFHLDSQRDHRRLSDAVCRVDPRVRPARRSGRSRQLSKGMRAKVSLALALASDPPLLVLDEPTSGLDVLVRREFLESMVDLAGAGRTVLLSSHQIGEVERVASHVALMHQGRLIRVEPLDELKSQDIPALGDVHQPRPPRRAAGRPNARADRCVRRPAAGALAGPGGRPRRLRGHPGVARSRGPGNRDAEPRGNLYRHHARPAPRALAPLAVHVA